ncbi:hypothetical protein DEO72_LG6g1151 [Vigna unguiculata]|uniref:Uncharacterized protein n=1 Tax=Vigna unguiculata TaxID=3917 RepID=A0A4D6M7B3_VIGUN|nr:hypothetical protein DEO72_LG6g1151 [Vigna unguiculata]
MAAAAAISGRHSSRTYHHRASVFFAPPSSPAATTVNSPEFHHKSRAPFPRPLAQNATARQHHLPPFAPPSSLQFRQTSSRTTAHSTIFSPSRRRHEPSSPFSQPSATTSTQPPRLHLHLRSFTPPP